MAKLFIVGFPREFEEIALVELFSFHGTVKAVTLVTDKETGQPKGYGFIIMNDDAGAKRAIDELDGTKICGRTISVRFADLQPPSKLSKIITTHSERDNRVKETRVKRSW